MFPHTFACTRLLLFACRVSDRHVALSAPATAVKPLLEPLVPLFPVRHRLLRFLPALGIALLWGAVLAFSGWQAATWLLRLKQPSAIVATEKAETDPIAAAQRIASHHSLGGGPNSANPSASAPLNVSNFTLLGVASHSGNSPGFAVLREQGELAQGYVEGEIISPGVRLTKITNDSVEIERNGARESVQLIESSPNRGASSPPKPISQNAEPTPNSPATPAPQNMGVKRNEMPNPQ